MSKRETAAERRAREAANRQEHEVRVWAEFTAQYPKRFAALLFAYADLDYAEFRVKKLDDETYEFSHKYTDVTLKVTPPLNYVWDVMNNLESAEYELKEYQEEVAEEERKYAVKQAALAKLSKEERELLGL